MLNKISKELILVSIIKISFDVINKYEVVICINNLSNGEKFLNISDKNPEKKITIIKNIENRLKSLLNKMINNIKKNPALKGILKEDIVNFLCFEKWVLSNRMFFFITNSLKATNKAISKKK